MSTTTDGWIKLATDMITEFGRATPATFTRRNLTGYDPNTLQASEAPATTYTVPCAPLDFNMVTLGMMEKQGVNDTAMMRQLYIPGGTSYTPLIGDTVQMDKVYRVLKIQNFETESINCAYLLWIGV